jgi:hypothetical protein
LGQPDRSRQLAADGVGASSRPWKIGAGDYPPLGDQEGLISSNAALAGLRIGDDPSTWIASRSGGPRWNTTGAKSWLAGKCLEQDWKPYLEGQIDLAAAVQRIVADYGVPKRAH